MNKPMSIPRCAAKRWIRLIGLSFIISHLSFSPAVAQQSVEYWIDSDPGLGSATSLVSSVPGGFPAVVNATIDTEGLGLAPGYHLLGFRAVDRSDGKSHYGPTLTQSFYVPNAPKDAAQLADVEYWIDTDPGLGKGTQVVTTAPDGSSEANTSFTIDIDALGLESGYHLLGFRAISYLAGKAIYGPTLTQTFYVPLPPKDAAQLSAVEYWIDSDPGLGKATQVATSAPDGSPVSATDFTIDTEGLGLEPGYHQLGFRAISYKSGKAIYGPTLTQTFYAPLPKTELVITQGEYFWNEDPGYGQGTPIAFTPGVELTIDNLAIPSHSVHGDATLFIRFQGTEGWSPTIAYTVMVDAEGNYTLNAKAETSMEARNYQTLPDALHDFRERGVGDDITLTVPTTSTDYTMTVETDSAVQSLTAITRQMLDSSTARHQKTIGFTAKAGSGNSITVTTTDGGDLQSPTLAATIAFFAQTWQENVALTINGTAYDFTPASQRMAEVCSGEETPVVALSAISTALRVTWQAQPHAGTVLSGFAAEGTGDLPAMPIANSGTEMDSVAYRVTLSDQEGQALYSYNYYIYVHARVSTQQFAGLSPANGSSLDPDKVTLRWNAIGDAVGGYRVSVAEVTEDAEGTEVIGTPVVTSHPSSLTSHTLTVKSGCKYQWTVTAIGYCDELISPTMTFRVRLLPDLAVTAITLPEAAQAGNTLTVKATIANQGEGATTEQTWTDRLYYVITEGTADGGDLQSPDIAAGTLAAEVKHTGNIAAGASYETTFQMKVPFVESGNLRVFVITDADGKVLESNDDNNRLLSPTSATLTPFYMDKNDLAMLRQLYNAFDGPNWSGTRWDISSELIKSGNWSGVTFDTEGRVVTINLQGRNLTGSLSAPFVPTLPQLTTLNLSRNALTGDPAKFITAEGLPALTALDLSYNQIDELSAPLPVGITSLSLAAQHRKYGASTTYLGLETLPTLTLDIGKGMTLTLPAILTYNHTAQNFTQHPQMNVYTPNLGTRYGLLKWDNIYERYSYTANSWKQTAQQDENVVLVVADGYTLATTVLPAKMHFTAGDANLTGWVDVNDVQRTLNYVINSNNSSVFGLWAANTYTAEESELLINIQDIVCTVNIVLENQGDDGDASRVFGESRASARTNGSSLYCAGRQLLLDATESIAALCVELRGVRADQVKLLLNQRDWQMQTRNTDGGVRLLLFSPTGESLPVCSGQPLLRLAATAEPVAATASNPEAESVGIAVSIEATGISDMDDFPINDMQSVYDLQGRKVRDADRRRHGLYIQNGRKQIVK